MHFPLFSLHLNVSVRLTVVVVGGRVAFGFGRGWKGVDPAGSTTYNSIMLSLAYLLRFYLREVGV